MARIVMVGGGIVGMTAATMLQRDGHDVTVLERDAQPPVAPRDAWDSWERRGVNQFRLPHLVLSRYTQILRSELPELAAAFEAGGALCWNFVDAYSNICGPRRDGDDRFDVITGRRPTMEAIAAHHALSIGVDVRRGTAVRGLAHRNGHEGPVDITGVITDTGENVDADLVVDSSGRRSSVPGMVRDLGVAGPVEERDDVGFVYYARHFRSADGNFPRLIGPVLQPYGSIVIVTLPADAGTWSVVICADAADAQLRCLTDPARWKAVVQAYPLAAHWTDAEPLTGVDVMAKIEDVRRHYVIDGHPVVTGLLPLGDAWACTNPTMGRGISIGALQAVALRDALRSTGTDDRHGLMRAWHELIEDRVEGHVDDTITLSRHRLTQLRTERGGNAYRTDDPVWNLSEAVRASALRDPDVFRHMLDVINLLHRDRAILDHSEIAERAVALAGSSALPGPGREELLELAHAATKPAVV